MNVIEVNASRSHLVEMGYDEELRQLEYDESFPVRGLWFDRQHGNLLKVIFKECILQV